MYMSIEVSMPLPLYDEKHSLNPMPLHSPPHFYFLKVSGKNSF